MVLSLILHMKVVRCNTGWSEAVRHIYNTFPRVFAGAVIVYLLRQHITQPVYYKEIS